MTRRPRILIARLGAMGDVIHALPAALSLCHSLPNCEIGWIVEERWSPLLCAAGTARHGAVSPQRPLVEHVHAVDTRGWRKSLTRLGTWRQIVAANREVRDLHYDIAIDIQGAIKSAALTSLSGAKVMWGFAHPRENVASLFYSRRCDVRAVHVIDQNLELAATVAASLSAITVDEPTGFVFPLDADAENWAREEIDRIHGDRIAIVNPGAGWGAKQWPAKSYAEVARWLHARDIIPLINFGPGEEALACEVVAMAPGARLLQASLARLTAIARRAGLFVGGDTGPLHLAAALDVPVVALFGPTDPGRNGPYCQRRTVLRSAQSETSYSHVSRVDAGLVSITAAETIAAAERLLES